MVKAGLFSKHHTPPVCPAPDLLHLGRHAGLLAGSETRRCCHLYLEQCPHRGHSHSGHPVHMLSSTPSGSSVTGVIGISDHDLVRPSKQACTYFICWRDSPSWSRGSRELGTLWKPLPGFKSQLCCWKLTCDLGQPASPGLASPCEMDMAIAPLRGGSQLPRPSAGAASATQECQPVTRKAPRAARVGWSGSRGLGGLTGRSLSSVP